MNFPEEYKKAVEELCHLSKTCEVNRYDDFIGLPDCHPLKEFDKKIQAELGVSVCYSGISRMAHHEGKFYTDGEECTVERFVHIANHISNVCDRRINEC